MAAITRGFTILQGELNTFVKIISLHGCFLQYFSLVGLFVILRKIEH